LSGGPGAELSLQRLRLLRLVSDPGPQYPRSGRKSRATGLTGCGQMVGCGLWNGAGVADDAAYASERAFHD